MQVELRPHTVRREVRKGVKSFGTYEADLGQYMIYVLLDDGDKPFRYGYVCKAAGSPINALIKLPPAVRKMIEDEVLAELDALDCDVKIPRRVIDPSGFQPADDDEVYEHEYEDDDEE